MKFIHLSDLHIGKKVNEFSMLEDQKYIFEEIISIIEQQNVDGVFIAGDIYDKSIPPREAVQAFDDFLTKIAKKRYLYLLLAEIMMQQKGLLSEQN